MKPMKPFLMLLALLAGMAQAQEPQNATLSHPDLPFAFDHPKEWVAKPVKYGVEVEIPVPGANEPAVLFVSTAEYRQEPQYWEESQAQIAKQLKREVVRQWREEILGIEMLMTKVSYTDKGENKMVVTALLYSANNRKLFMRLTGPADGFDNIEYAFREALLTLRTTDGSMPKREDPSRKPDPTLPAGRDPDKPVKITPIVDPAKPKKIEKATTIIPVTVGGRESQLRIPEGWTYEKTGEYEFTLKNPGLRVPVKVRVASSLDSDQPGPALFKASSATLSDFTKVEKRTETQPKENKAGATMLAVWRQGTGPNGILTTCDAVGGIDKSYWLLNVKVEGGATADERKLLEALLDAMSVEANP